MSNIRIESCFDQNTKQFELSKALIETTVEEDEAAYDILKAFFELCVEYREYEKIPQIELIETWKELCGIIGVTV